MDLLQKLEILADSAKYDVACTSSGADRKAKQGTLGNTSVAGICHSFSADGRCISLLKVLMTNSCIYDCKYCVNRRSNDTQRATFTPRELAELTINFYKRNYIEGLFLSSGIIKNPDYTCELMIKTLEILRNEYQFGGYIHSKAIPGADQILLQRLGKLTDRMSVNIEMPSQKSLALLAPDKSKKAILEPMQFITNEINKNSKELTLYKHSAPFVPAGQSTQMIIGASPESDYQILSLTQSLYNKYKLKRVFFSAYIPANNDSLLPAIDTKPPLLREHRLYQSDWLLRYYKFKADEILSEENPNFNPYLDPKCNWALHNMQNFPIEINKASYDELLRVPGIGPTSAKKIVKIRRVNQIDFETAKRIGIVLKRAQYFITCKGKMMQNLSFRKDTILRSLMSKKAISMYSTDVGKTLQTAQISMFDSNQLIKEEIVQCLTGQI